VTTLSRHFNDPNSDMPLTLGLLDRRAIYLSQVGYYFGGPVSTPWISELWGDKLCDLGVTL